MSALTHTPFPGQANTQAPTSAKAPTHIRKRVACSRILHGERERRARLHHTHRAHAHTHTTQHAQLHSAPGLQRNFSAVRFHSNRSTFNDQQWTRDHSRVLLTIAILSTASISRSPPPPVHVVPRTRFVSRYAHCRARCACTLKFNRINSSWWWSCFYCDFI